METNSHESTQKTIPELEIDAAELDVLRAQLCMEKQGLQGQLAEINATLKSAVLPTKEYHRLMSIRGGVVKQLTELDQRIAAVKVRRMEVLVVRDVRKHEVVGVGDIKRLVELRDRWHDFSMDKANPQRAREVAWKFSQELREILKRYFNGGAQSQISDLQFQTPTR